MTKLQTAVLCCLCAFVLAIGVAGCTPRLRKRVLDGVGRVVASPTLPTLISEVAAILLSDEWRAELELKARKHGRAQVRAAVEANAHQPAASAEPIPESASRRAVRGDVPAPFSPDLIIRSRALLWLADDDRAQACGGSSGPVTRSDCTGL